MLVAIRVDASTSLGMGHLVRCMTLAETLQDHGAEVWFVYTELLETHELRLQEAGFGTIRMGSSAAGAAEPSGTLGPGQPPAAPQVVDQETDASRVIDALQNLPAPVDWIVVDHYGIDARCEGLLRAHTRRLMVIDDLADRRHECDLLLDQNLGSEAPARYVGLIPGHCTALLGPRYALLRKEFLAARERAQLRSGPLRRLLVSFGATDPTGEAARSIEAVHSLGLSDLRVDVVAPSLGRNDRVRAIARDMRDVRIHGWTDSMAQLMVESDLALGAGGSSSWERCYLGLPSVTVIVAENQRRATQALADAGATLAVEGGRGAIEAELAVALRRFVEDRDLLRSTSEKAFAVMGEPFPSGAELVVSTMMEIS
ncbi:MAG: UDP-2,4-diacetamido-2,4,6-trideoxy-beta-L-altropyranose hydrolase [Thermoleophilia bacterium]